MKMRIPLGIVLAGLALAAIVLMDASSGFAAGQGGATFSGARSGSQSWSFFMQRSGAGFADHRFDDHRFFGDHRFFVGARVFPVFVGPRVIIGVPVVPVFPVVAVSPVVVSPVVVVPAY